MTTARQVYRRIYDHESGQYFYVNLINGSSSWTRPKIFISEEPPILLQLEDGRDSDINHNNVNNVQQEYSSSYETNNRSISASILGDKSVKESSAIVKNKRNPLVNRDRVDFVSK